MAGGLINSHRAQWSPHQTDAARVALGMCAGGRPSRGVSHAVRSLTRRSPIRISRSGRVSHCARSLPRHLRQGFTAPGGISVGRALQRSGRLFVLHLRNVSQLPRYDAPLNRQSNPPHNPSRLLSASNRRATA